jgi:hypothetical protein
LTRPDSISAGSRTSECTCSAAAGKGEAPQMIFFSWRLALGPGIISHIAKCCHSDRCVTVPRSVPRTSGPTPPPRQQHIMCCVRDTIVVAGVKHLALNFSLQLLSVICRRLDWRVLSL